MPAKSFDGDTPPTIPGGNAPYFVMLYDISPPSPHGIAATRTARRHQRFDGRAAWAYGYARDMILLHGHDRAEREAGRRRYYSLR